MYAQDSVNGLLSRQSIVIYENIAFYMTCVCTAPTLSGMNPTWDRGIPVSHTSDVTSVVKVLLPSKRMKCEIVFLFLAGFALSSVSGHAIPQNCSARYQSAIREAMEIKEECGDAGAYDCCQVGLASV